MKLIDKDNINQILSGIDNILVDCDGVIWGGGYSSVIFNNANLAINKLKSLGKKVFLITNNAWRTQEEIFEKCKSLDMNIELESIISAPYVMAQYLKGLNFSKKLYIMGPQALANELTKWGFQCDVPQVENMNLRQIYVDVARGQIGLDPEVGAVVADMDMTFNYSKLLKASCYLTDPDCLFLANYLDTKYPVLNTKYFLPAGGVLVRAIEAASGRTATVIGKPSRLMYDVLATKHGLVAEKTMIIGDTLETDISFGNKCGLQTLFVLTGVSTLEDVEKAQATEKENDENSLLIPQYYLPSLGDFNTLIE